VKSNSARAHTSLDLCEALRQQIAQKEAKSDGDKKKSDEASKPVMQEVITVREALSRPAVEL
jgi:hypothetical protein